MTTQTDFVDLGPGAPLQGPVRTKIQVPSGVVVLTDRRVARGGLVRVVAAAVAGGVRWVVLREKDLPRAERLALAVELRSILTEVGGTLIVAGPDPVLDDDPGRSVTAEPGSRTWAGGTGTGSFPIALHLPAAGPYPPPPADLVGRSCHDAAELRRLTTEDYVTLSPVFPTRTKPGYGPPLLAEGLAELIRLSPVPALALGGIETPAQVHACVQAGASGVAVLGAIMRANDPQRTATTLTAAFHATTAPEPAKNPPSWHVPAGDDHDGAAADRAHAGIKPDRPEWARSAAAPNRNHKTTPDQEDVP
ncbi:hypothetical protein Van01_09320 [Micromonospora andamanensis]|uniref:Thiamine phosphate synthase/TenI domain-containing protein n=1 Tax=Micromonospora andamanensis TaxID=1287068 RepID=A0ABQ4HQ01_9ACTN|nr:hypothetical protein Van01_09320 [Micromonospora andamanensis]